jgi:DNA-binding NarL/FixJ family response regulator
MRSRLEARQGSSRASTDWAKLRASDLSVASHLDKTITQTGSDRLDQSLSGKTSAPIKTSAPTKRSAPIEKARLAAPKAVTHCAGTQATRHGRELANPHGALQTGLPVPQRLNGASEGESGSVKLKRPGIVVIHRRAVFRDCFVRCLEISYKDHDVLPFANVVEWCNSKEPNALAAAVVIIVIDDGDETGVAELKFLETVAAKIPVVIVSNIDDLDHIVRVLKSGARGYIPTSLPFNVAVEAVRLVKAGGTFVPASSFVHNRDEQQLRTNGLLTEQQMKVVEEIRQGKANKQIAYELNMSEHTVKVHLRHIMRKLNAKNRTEVAVLSRDFIARAKECLRENSDVRPDKGSLPI